jgi:hypothetical protein
MGQALKTSLEAIVRERGIELKRSGSGRFVGLCPFHSEKTPSFTVYPDNKFHCFGCGEHGDAIEFLRKLHGLSYFETLELLGRERPAFNSKVRQELRKKRQEDLKASWKESDLSWTLGKLMRLGHRALKTLTPENFETYAGLVENLADWERWHDVIIYGSLEEKDALMEDLKDFEIFQRGRLWREDFDYRAWLKSISRSKTTIYDI